MAFTERQLGQKQGTESATVVYAPGSFYIGIVREVMICNREKRVGEFYIWHDDDGSTFDGDSVLFQDATIDPKTTVTLDVFWPVSSSGHMAVQSGTNGSVTFTVYGAEVEK